MKIKTSELIGPALDWAVAKCEGYGREMLNVRTRAVFCVCGPLRFSTDWSQGGPIIDREMLGTMPVSDAWWRAGDVDGANGFGPTPLVAAMRCFVTSKLGDEVDVPEELCQS